MNKTIYKAALSLAIALGLAGCNEKWEPGDTYKGDTGKLSTQSINLDITNSEKVITGRSTVDLSNYIVTVNNADGQQVEQWTFSQMPGLPELAVGDYTLTVESMTPQRAAWDAPYFVGSKKFTIVKNDITEIGTVTCTLQNLKVTVKFTADLQAAAPEGDLNCQVRVNQEGVLDFTPAESRSGYFDVIPGNTTMVATFTGTVNGYKEEIIRLYTDIKPGNHYIITFSLKANTTTPPGETGTLDPTDGINVDFEVINQDLSGNVDPGDEEVIVGTRPGGEEWPDDPTPPTPPTPGDEEDIFFTSTYLNLADGNSNPVDGFGPGEKEAIVEIKADEGIAHLYVVIDSETLDLSGIEGFNTSFDLCYPVSDFERDALKGLTLPVAEEVIDKTECQFDITTFVPLLKGFDGTHRFLLTVVDNGGHTKKLTLTFQN